MQPINPQVDLNVTGNCTGFTCCFPFTKKNKTKHVKEKAEQVQEKATPILQERTPYPSEISSDIAVRSSVDEKRRG